MNNVGRVLLILSVGFFVTIASIVGYVVNKHNSFVSLEAGIEAQYKQNQNNYDNYFKKIKEMVQVNDMYADDFKKVYDDLMKGRYGENGSKAMFQWIQENMPNFDSSMYKNVQREISAGRKDFENNQKMLLDKKATYKSSLKKIPAVYIATFMGFPKIDLKEMDIVTSDSTDKAFKTKKSEPLKLRD